MRKNLTTGKTVHIRLSTEDIMGCIDVVEASNVQVPGMSLALVVRLALSGLLEAARVQGSIPKRDGFEYEEMISRYGGSKAIKVKISNTMYAQNQQREAADIPPIRSTVVSRLSSETRSDDQALDDELRLKGRKLLRHKELEFQWKHERDNMTTEEQQKYHTLCDSLHMVELV